MKMNKIKNKKVKKKQHLLDSSPETPESPETENQKFLDESGLEDADKSNFCTEDRPEDCAEDCTEENCEGCENCEEESSISQGTSQSSTTPSNTLE